MSIASDFKKLRAYAMTFPEAEEGTSCNKSSFKAGNKGYCYLGIKEDSFNLMVKIGPSQAEAETLEKKQPDCFSVGKGGWVKAEFQSNQKPPIRVLERWIEESYRLLVHKELVAQLDAGRSKKSNPKKGVRKNVVRAKTTVKKKK